MEIGLLGAFAFIGWSLGCLLISPYADAYGRKGPFLSAVFIQFFVWILILLCYNLYATYLLLFIFGLCIAGRYTVGFVFLVESIPKAHRIQIGLLINLAEAATVILVTIYFKFISKNWLGF